MDDGCPVMAIPHMTLWVRWAKKRPNTKENVQHTTDLGIYKDIC